MTAVKPSVNTVVREPGPYAKRGDAATGSVAQNREAASIFMAHYDIQRELEHPIIEYARYVLKKGSDEEKTKLVTGIQNKLILKDETIRIYRED